jgi:hypothetical protein
MLSIVCRAVQLTGGKHSMLCSATAVFGCAVEAGNSVDACMRMGTI